MSDDTNDILLREALARVSKPKSHYWTFWTPDGLDLDQSYEVEIRLNVPDGNEVAAAAPDGWTISHRKTGMLFLRRFQHLDKPTILDLFAEALKIAVSNGWQFHSWLHAPYLIDRDTPTTCSNSLRP